LDLLGAGGGESSAGVEDVNAMAHPNAFDVLFEPAIVGELRLSNRVVMAPMTRHRAAEATLAQTELNATYYRQRASAGLIISEASQISQQGQGYIRTPGIYTPDQVRGWRLVTDAVHRVGGTMFCQLWHVGRMSHVSLQPNADAPVAPSAIAANARIYIDCGFVAPSTPRALRTEEIPALVSVYAVAAENALRAGFDGVELHGANGYLIDQFLRDGSNRRQDQYGGSVENRLRFPLDVVDAAVRIWGCGRVGIRIAPQSTEGDMSDSNPAAIFGAFLVELARRRVAYVHVVQGTGEFMRTDNDADLIDVKKYFPGTVIFNNGYTPGEAAAAISSGRCDLVSFGRPFISNPDLVRRFRERLPLSPIDNATVYGGSAAGYIDYPQYVSA
jgi:N-ethylmaleimide reductase